MNANGNYFEPPDKDGNSVDVSTFTDHLKPPKPPDDFEALLRWLAAHRGRLEFSPDGNYVVLRIYVEHGEHVYSWLCRFTTFDLAETFPIILLNLTRSRLEWERMVTPGQPDYARAWKGLDAAIAKRVLGAASARADEPLVVQPPPS